MTLQTTLAPPNSLLLFKDAESGDIPASMKGALVAATLSCVAVGTLLAADGETRVVLTDDVLPPNIDTKLHRIFSGEIRTPKKQVAVCTVQLQEVLSLEVEHMQTRLVIWADDLSEPGFIVAIVQQDRARKGKAESKDLQGRQ